MPEVRNLHSFQRLQGRTLLAPLAPGVPRLKTEQSLPHCDCFFSPVSTSALLLSLLKSWTGPTLRTYLEILNYI